MVAVCLWFFLGLSVLVAPAAAAVPPREAAVVERARGELVKENYEEALEVLLQAWQAGIRTPETAFLLGQTHRGLLRYQEAKGFLQEAVRLRPDFREAQLLLADTLVGLEQPDQALPLLKELEAARYQISRTAYVRGLALYKKNRYQEALEAFRLAQQDPQVAQDAKLQEAMALSALNRLQEARKTLQDAIGLNPRSPTAGFAQGYAAVLDRRLKEYRRLRLTAFGGFDYDSNVALQPGTEAGLLEVSRKNDVFWSLAASVEYNFLPPGPLAVWGYYGYYQNFHHRLTHYDLVSNSAGVVPMYTWARSRLTVPFQFNYSVVGYRPYATSFTVAPAYLVMVSPKVAVEGGALWARRNYWFPVVLDADRRTADVLGATLAAYYFLKGQEGYLQARFTYEREFTLGRNWDSNSFRFGLAFQYPFRPDLRVKVSGDVILQPYDNYWHNGIPGAAHPKRYDNLYLCGVELVKKLPKNLELAAHCYFIRDDSNIALYDYDRMIAGLQFGFRY